MTVLADKVLAGVDLLSTEDDWLIRREPDDVNNPVKLLERDNPPPNGITVVVPLSPVISIFPLLSSYSDADG